MNVAAMPSAFAYCSSAYFWSECGTLNSPLVVSAIGGSELKTKCSTSAPATALIRLRPCSGSLSKCSQ
jgi:hypothetical protein